MSNKILVTGAAGFIGSYLVERLVEKGEKVVVTIFSKDSINYLRPGLANQTFVGDIRDIKFVEKAMKGCNRVYHLASAQNYLGISAEDFYTTNVEGTRNVMEVALKQGVKKVVHVSSSTAIKENKKRVDENDLFRGWFDGPYSFSKYKGEKVAFEYGARGLAVVAVNPTIVYGPRQMRSLGQIFKNFIEPRVRFVGFKNMILNLIYVKDVAEGIICAMQKGRTGHRYILGGHEMTLGQFIALLDELTGTHKPIITVPEFLLKLGASLIEPLFKMVRLKPPLLKAQVSAMQRGAAADISKARKELGLPVSSVREKLKETLDWYKMKGMIKF
tara:strand:- start:104 stop:1093 length:990 start_codon:yes stop_codon:yes gene_type:complete